MLRIENVRLFTGRETFADGCVLINDSGRIEYAGALSGCPETVGCKQMYGGGGILMPGFYNAHSHAAMVLMRGVGSDLTLMNWLHQIFPIEDKLSGELVYWGSMLAIQEMLRRGVVAFADMYFFMDHVARAAIETGIRLNMVRGCTDVAGVESVPALHEEFHDAVRGTIKVYMGLHAEYTSTEEVASRAIAVAKQLNTGFHVHLSETRGEVEGSFDRRGKSPVQYFYDLGAFERPTIAAHCVHLDDNDIKILAKTGVYAVHNPASNLKLASGIAPVHKYLKSGMKVALGTDGASSNNRLDMLSDMRLASILQKGAFGNPTLLPAKQAIEMATRTGALAMGFDDCGLLEKGMQADMILLDGNSENLSIAPDLPAAIVYGAQGLNVSMTMVAGRILYKDGQFMTLMPERVKERAMEAARKIGVI